MNKPEKCPHGWNDCTDCLYKQLCHLGLCEPELEAQKEQHQAVIEAAAVADELVNEEVINAAKKIKRVPLVDAEPEVFWLWWARTSPEDPMTMQKDVLTPIPGAIKPGGGKLKRKKSAKGNMIFTTDWDEL